MTANNANDGSAAEPNPRKRRRSRFAAAPSSSPTGQVSADAINDGSNAVKAGAELDLSAIPVAPVSTLKINQHVARSKKLKRSLKVLEDDLLETDPALNTNFDPDIRTQTRTRRLPRRNLNFVTEGVISEIAEKSRHDAERAAADLLFRKAMAARATQAAATPSLSALATGVLDDRRSDSKVPAFEWWDSPFIDKDSSLTQGPSSMLRLRDGSVTHYIHQPLNIPSYKPTKAPVVLPLMLTEKERKRLRRQRRLEKETETREMIAVGLLPPPPPKVKLSNLMRVLASEATADPTKVEADVRAQVAERLRKHEADNEARKRTKDQLRIQAAEKIAKDRDAGTYVNVYRVLNVDNPSHRFKVDMNARQLGLTGTFIVFADCNLIIVEGGVKALRKYKKLVLRRINWTEGLGDNADSEAPPNSCVVVFEGPIAQPSFDGFRLATILTASSVKSFLRSRGVESFFDAAMNTSPSTKG